MNTRKFTYITTLVLGMFLFALGIIFLFYINNVAPEPGSNAPIPQILNGLSGTKKNDPMNFLLLVGDKASGNTDSMMVANYNPDSKQVSIVTIPRDTKVKLINNILPKINAAYAAGGREHKGAIYASEVVSNLSGININYYVHINISSIKKITDMLGGVSFEVPADLRYEDPTQDLHIDLKKGYQLLDGDKVEQLLRFRKPSERLYSRVELKELRQFYDGSDIKRTEMQVKFIKEFISQKLNIQYLPKFNSVLNYAFQNIITNMMLSDALKLTSGVINVSADNFNSFRLDGEDKIINGGWFYVYNGNMIDIDTKESLPAEDIVSRYFKSVGGIATPSELFVPEDQDDDEPAKTTKKSTKKNPSNSQTDTKGTGKDKP
ncbi:MAG: cell envelope-related transcriptional attenuator [Eubacterium sp.]|nr:cell envelope-related transcriptional attenuator [Eubacterium sp.]